MFSHLLDWFSTLSLVFGGCCSNAITLEQLTSLYPSAGSLITFCQFLVISLQGLSRHVIWTRYGPRFKPRRIPLMFYFVQVALYYLVSLLNNIAFGYNIPMSVHIIFRSGGLVVTMLLGWIVAKKKYNITEIISIVTVTVGVLLTTMSASKQSPESGNDSISTYLTGIAILTLALIFAGFLGLVQDYTYTKYGRPSPVEVSSSKPTNTNSPAAPPPTWQESMFYLHFLALPMFITVRKDIISQIHAIQRGPVSTYTLPIPQIFSIFHDPLLYILPSLPFNMTLPVSIHTKDDDTYAQFVLSSATLPLILNTLTQSFCAAGVNRLTTRVSALTVTLVLVVRKAVSLVLSVVLGFGKAGGKSENVDLNMMWSGAALVMLGTVGYSFGRKATRPREKKE
ncbi:UAA transporter [Marasmius fiardii PR-910]|nr:UAA transporter [Marasmius fiardii PR-910]